jgi:hypothetical protein
MILTRGITIGGLLEGAVNHVKGVLDKANDKRFNEEMQRISDSSPEGKRAVESALNYKKGRKK